MSDMSVCAERLLGGISCVCMDAPKRYAMVPCMQLHACEACAQQLLHVTRSCARRACPSSARCACCCEPRQAVASVP